MITHSFGIILKFWSETTEIEEASSNNLAQFYVISLKTTDFI